MTVVAVDLWGRRVGAISDEGGLPAFEYDPDWRASACSISPFHLPLERGVFSFPELRRQEGFLGMPGVFADSLPDRFGNRVIRAYLASQGKSDIDIAPAEKLLYVGARGMGALEYQPAIPIRDDAGHIGIELGVLVEQARQVIHGDVTTSIPDIMAAASSAGGVRAKALVGWRPDSDEIIAHAPELPAGFEHWIIKFDGMHEDGRPQHWTRLEFAYNEMARAAGVDVAESTLLADGGLAHFMSRRFDRADGRKIHLHSLCGMRHADYNEPRSWSYELYFRTCLGLGLGMDELGEAYRRMVFNVVARNQDDHSKNIAFLKDGIESDWRLAPAFDVTYAHGAGWTLAHQMSVNGKFEGIGRDDLDAVAELYGIRRHGEIIDEGVDAVSRWPEFAERAGLDAEVTARVGRDHEFPGA